jgi:protein-tyrosine-phosphatase
MNRDRLCNVLLLLCNGNSARSTIGEAIVNRIGAGKFKGYSVGSIPKDEVHPSTINLLKKLNYHTCEFRSKSWEEFTAPGAPELDFVFTVCDNAANEACPIWPGQPMTAHWGLPDPIDVKGDETQRALAFANTYRMLNNRSSIFTNLPLSSLDELSRQKQLDAIGQSKGTVAPERA